MAVAVGPDLGLVAADCRNPGLPLIYISGGFRGVTGYGKEQLGLPCSFLQGSGTEGYVVEEIVDALRFARPECSKLLNYKKNGDEFQCVVVLHPIFASPTAPKYAFQIGMQFDLTSEPDDKLYHDTLHTLSDVTRFMPTTVDGFPNALRSQLTSAKL